MALIAISGHPGCRFEEVARFSAQRLGFELLTQARIRSLTREEFGESAVIPDKAYPSPAAEAQLQFQMRFRLSRYGIVPPGNITLRKKIFANASEEIFANLLDFYRIAWEYEPRSFPIHYTPEGAVLESFTPDFFLPEFDLYVELTTMKQSLVTRKNRKVRLLKAIYPHVNIRVFYEKDFQELVSKYGLSERGQE